MNKLSKNFNREEFSCKCGCGYDNISPELIGVLQELRDWFDSPIHINSGCRCCTHNKSVGGVPSSRHTWGTAADIVVSGLTPQEVYEYLDSKYPQSLGLGLYETFVHIDVRKDPARWNS